MATETNTPAPRTEPPGEHLEMPAPTYWPLVLAVGVTLMGAGIITNYLFTAVGFVLFLIALWNWLADLLPGKGHIHEELVEPAHRPQPVQAHLGEVEALRMGMPGHRMRLPEKMHPYSAGAKGGMVGGIAMIVPAGIYCLVSGHSIWYPINLLAGMVLALPQDVKQVEQFHFGWFVTAVVIHIALSIGLGLMYGVLLPMLGGRPLFWGGVVAPLLWTGAAYGFMGVLNPTLQKLVDWPTFILAQFVYGVCVGIVVVRSEQVYSEPAGAGPVGPGQPQRTTPGGGQS